VGRTILLVIPAVTVAFLFISIISPGLPFQVPAYEVPLVRGLLASIGLGLIAGALAVLHIRFTYWVRHQFLNWRKPPLWLTPMLGGLVLGSVGIFWPQLTGIGYETIEYVLRGDERLLSTLIILLAGKIVMMAISFGSGFLGGFFAPSFFIGAMLGASYGFAIALFSPVPTIEPAALAVIGMAAFLAGALHAPLTAAFVTYALGAGTSMLPFIIPACLISFFLAKRLERGSLYTFTIKDEPPSDSTQAGSTRPDSHRN
jgi:chloride channel protein, CIC family